MNSILEETRFLLKKYHINANKSLGQNFLIDENVIDNIISSAEIDKNDLVIEIGPGLGTLTAKLLEVSGKVISIELDDRMVNILEDRFKFYNNFNLIHDDILKVDLKALIAKEANFSSVKIVANLPYYITTPIIMKLLENMLPIKSITVMVQKEVADRLTAIPGSKNTGAITYCVYYYCTAKEVLLVPNSSFIPAPEVNSEVIKLDIRKIPPVKLENKELFFRVIKASFMQRRKTLLNGLANSKISTKEILKNMLHDLNLDENIRGESLSIEQFAKISNYLSKKNSC